jgi:hypothetical protein
VLAGLLVAGCGLADRVLLARRESVLPAHSTSTAGVVAKRGSPGPTIYRTRRASPHTGRPPAAGVGRAGAAPESPGTRAPARATRGWPAANDAADPQAQGPTPAHDSAVTSLIGSWLHAYLAWSLNTSAPDARRVLRADSTPKLYAQVRAHPPVAAPALRPPSLSVHSVATFRAPHGYSAVVDLTALGISQAVALEVIRTPDGLRVSRLDV